MVMDDPAEKERTWEDLTDKETQLLIRIYPMTPNGELCRKFNIPDKELAKLREKLKTEGVELYKNPDFDSSLVTIKPGHPTTDVKTGTKSHLLASFLNSVGEQERRELINFYEENPDTQDMMRQVIVIQAARVARGGKYESGSTGLHKTMNEAQRDLMMMISKLDEMENGQKHIHGVDDSFVGLVLASQKQGDKWVSGED